MPLKKSKAGRWFWIVHNGLVGILFILAGGCTRSPPSGVQRFSKIVETDITPTEPDPQWKRGYQILPFVKMTSGEIVAPIVQVERPRRSGPMSAIRYERVWETGITAVGDGDRAIILPADLEIAEYILLVRPLSELGTGGDSLPWRVWAVEAEKVAGEKASRLMLPKLTSLELLSDRKDEAEFLSKKEAARDFNNK